MGKLTRVVSFLGAEVWALNEEYVSSFTENCSQLTPYSYVVPRSRLIRRRP